MTKTWMRTFTTRLSASQRHIWEAGALKLIVMSMMSYEHGGLCTCLLGLTRDYKKNGYGVWSIARFNYM